MKTKQTRKSENWLLACVAGLSVFAGSALATQTPLMFRNETPIQIHGGLTDHILDTSWGTNVLTLAFTNTTTYDFYTPPLTASAYLSASGNGGASICMGNSSSSGANSVTVTGEMRYSDYDPATGAETLFLDTGVSPTKNVNNGQTVSWATPTPAMPGAYTIPAGHMLHAALTIVLVSGNPGNYVSLVYNAPAGSNKFTEAQLSENNTGSLLVWSLTPVQPAPLTIFQKNNGQISLTGYGSPQTVYSFQCTSNLATGIWTTMGTTISDDGGLFNYLDKDTTKYPCRFYRTVSQ